VHRREVGHQRHQGGGVEAFAGPDHDRRDHQREVAELAQCGRGEYEQARRRDGTGPRRHHHDAPAALGRLRDRNLRDHDGRCVREQQQPDQRCTDAQPAPGVRRDHPREHAPADRDDHRVGRRKVHERAIPEHPPVAAAERLGARGLAHDQDQDTDVAEVGDGVEQEEGDQPRQPIPCDQAARGPAGAEADVGADA